MILIRQPRPRTFILALLLAVVSPVIPRAIRAADTGSETWPEITAEDKGIKRVEQDPDADAVVLINERNGKITRKGDDIVNATENRYRVKILTPRGVTHYSDFRIPASKFSRVTNIHARTVKTDGTVVSVAADQIFEKETYHQGGTRETEWVFHFPAVEPGAILDVQYERNDNSLLFILPFYFASPEYTLRARVTQAVPEDMGYTVLCDLCPSGQSPSVAPWREGKAKGQIYAMEVRNLPAYRSEELMPPPRDANPRLEMLLAHWKNYFVTGLGRQNQFFIDWPSVALYAWTYYQEAMKAGMSDVKPVAETWVQGITDPQERIRAVFRHVQRDFRYRPFTQVYGSSRKISAMLKDKEADNEDKAVLLMTALKSLGIDSYTVLVSGKDGGSLNPKFFSFSQFTHTIVAVPQTDGSRLWLDPTVGYAPFGFMPWKDSGAEGMLIKDGKGEMVTLPQKNELSSTRYGVLVKPRKDGNADVEVEAEFAGEDAIDLREELVPAAEAARKTYLQDWVSDRRSGAQLASFTIEDLDNQDKPLRIKMTLTAPGLVTVADEAVLVRGCVLDCEDSNPISRAARQYPFYVDRGWNNNETVTVKAPDGMVPSDAPPPSTTKSSLATHTFSCTSAEGAVKCSHVFVARRNRWPASEQTNIRAMYDKVVEADQTRVAFQPAPASAGGQP